MTDFQTKAGEIYEVWNSSRFQKMLKSQKTKHNDGDKWKNSQLSKLEIFEQKNKVVLDYNPICKINIHEFILA
jgi:hypothetical protein